MVTSSDIDQLILGYVSEQRYVQTRYHLFRESSNLPAKVPIIELFGNINSEHRLETILNEYVTFKLSKPPCPICGSDLPLSEIWKSFDVIVSKIKSLTKTDESLTKSVGVQLRPVSPSEISASGGRGRPSFGMSPNVKSSSLRIVPMTEYHPIGLFQRKELDLVRHERHVNSLDTTTVTSAIGSSPITVCTNSKRETRRRKKKTSCPKRLDDIQRIAMEADKNELYAHDGDLSQLLNFNVKNNVLAKVGANIITNMKKCAEKGQKSTTRTAEKNRSPVVHVSSPFKDASSSLEIDKLMTKELRGDLVDMTIDSLLGGELDPGQHEVSIDEHYEQDFLELRKLLGFEESSLEQVTSIELSGPSTLIEDRSPLSIATLHPTIPATSGIDVCQSHGISSDPVENQEKNGEDGQEECDEILTECSMITEPVSVNIDDHHGDQITEPAVTENPISNEIHVPESTCTTMGTDDSEENVHVDVSHLSDPLRAEYGPGPHESNMIAEKIQSPTSPENKDSTEKISLNKNRSQEKDSDGRNSTPGSSKANDVSAVISKSHMQNDIAFSPAMPNNDILVAESALKACMSMPPKKRFLAQEQASPQKKPTSKNKSLKGPRKPRSKSADTSIHRRRSKKMKVVLGRVGRRKMASLSPKKTKQQIVDVDASKGSNYSTCSSEATCNVAEDVTSLISEKTITAENCNQEEMVSHPDQVKDPISDNISPGKKDEQNGKLVNKDIRIPNGAVRTVSPTITELSPAHHLRRSSRRRKPTSVLPGLLKNNKVDIGQNIGKGAKGPGKTLTDPGGKDSGNADIAKAYKVMENICRSSNRFQVPALVSLPPKNVEPPTVCRNAQNITQSKQNNVHVMKPGQGSVVISLKKQGRMPVHVQGIVVQPKQGNPLSREEIIGQLVKQMQPVAVTAVDSIQQANICAPQNPVESDLSPTDDKMLPPLAIPSAENSKKSLSSSQNPLLLDTKDEDIVLPLKTQDNSSGAKPISFGQDQSQPAGNSSPPSALSLMPFSLPSNQPLSSLLTPPKYHQYENKFSTISPSAGIFSVMDDGLPKVEIQDSTAEKSALTAAKSNLFASFLSQDHATCVSMTTSPEKIDRPPDKSLEYVTLNDVIVINDEEVVPVLPAADRPIDFATPESVLPALNSPSTNTADRLSSTSTKRSEKRIGRPTRKGALKSSKITFKRRKTRSGLNLKPKKSPSGIYLCNHMKNMIRIEPKRYAVPGVRRYYVNSNSQQTLSSLCRPSQVTAENGLGLPKLTTDTTNQVNVIPVPADTGLPGHTTEIHGAGEKLDGEVSQVDIGKDLGSVRDIVVLQQITSDVKDDANVSPDPINSAGDPPKDEVTETTVHQGPLNVVLQNDANSVSCDKDCSSSIEICEVSVSEENRSFCSRPPEVLSPPPIEERSIARAEEDTATCVGKDSAVQKQNTNPHKKGNSDSSSKVESYNVVEDKCSRDCDDGKVRRRKRKIRRESDSSDNRKKKKLSRLLHSPVMTWSYKEIQAKLNLLHGKKKNNHDTSVEDDSSNVAYNRQEELSSKTGQPSKDVNVIRVVPGSSPYTESDPQLMICEDITSPERRDVAENPDIQNKSSVAKSLESIFDDSLNETSGNIDSNPGKKKCKEISPSAKASSSYMRTSGHNKRKKKKSREKKGVNRKQYSHMKDASSHEEISENPVQNPVLISNTDEVIKLDVASHQHEPTPNLQRHTLAVSPTPKSPQNVGNENGYQRQEFVNPPAVTQPNASPCSIEVESTLDKKRPRRISLIPVSVDDANGNVVFPEFRNDSITEPDATPVQRYRDSPNTVRIVADSLVELSTREFPPELNTYATLEPEANPEIRLPIADLEEGECSDEGQNGGVIEEVIFDPQYEPLDLSCSSFCVNDYGASANFKETNTKRLQPSTGDLHNNQPTNRQQYADTSAFDVPHDRSTFSPVEHRSGRFNSTSYRTDTSHGRNRTHRRSQTEDLRSRGWSRDSRDDHVASSNLQYRDNNQHNSSGRIAHRKSVRERRENSIEKRGRFDTSSRYSREGMDIPRERLRVRELSRDRKEPRSSSKRRDSAFRMDVSRHSVSSRKSLGIGNIERPDKQFEAVRDRKHRPDHANRGVSERRSTSADTSHRTLISSSKAARNAERIDARTTHHNSGNGITENDSVSNSNRNQRSVDLNRGRFSDVQSSSADLSRRSLSGRSKPVGEENLDRKEKRIASSESENRLNEIRSVSDTSREQRSTDRIYSKEKRSIVRKEVLEPHGRQKETAASCGQIAIEKTYDTARDLPEICESNVLTQHNPNSYREGRAENEGITMEKDRNVTNSPRTPFDGRTENHEGRISSRKKKKHKKHLKKIDLDKVNISEFLASLNYDKVPQ